MLVLPAWGQSNRRVWRIGFLGAGSRPSSMRTTVYGAFIQGMNELGYVENKHFVMEWRFADGKYEALPSLARELIAAKVDMIVTGASFAAQAAQRETRTIPIINGGGGDPVSMGMAKSLSRPGGNVTGVAGSSQQVSLKYLELLKTALPKLSRVAVLSNPSSSFVPTVMKNVESSAEALGVRLVMLGATTVDDLENAFAKMKRERVDAAILIDDAFFNLRRQQIAVLALKNRLPLLGGQRHFAEAGALMSYGEDLNENLRRLASYVDRILKGANPGELAIEQRGPILVINRNTAKGLGIVIPNSLLVRADEVID